jgi:hypothetical protein
MDNGVARKLTWDPDELVEGTEVLLWTTEDPDAAEADALPDPSTALRGVISSVRQRVMRFQLSSEEALGDLVLVGTVAVGGPTQFVVRRSNQAGRMLVCDPPQEIRVFERREQFRVPVATVVVIASPAGTWSLSTTDCSVGGFGTCLPEPIEVGTEVQVRLSLDGGIAVTVPAVARYCRPARSPSGGAAAATSPPARAACLAGFQFGMVHAEVERRLSQFVGRHQRRLMPRVQAGLLVEYRSHGRAYFIEALATELSPGDVVIAVRESHVPGDHLDLKFRVGRQTFEFSARAVACYNSDDSGATVAHVVRASFGDASDVVETQFRKAVRDLAIEQTRPS